MTATPDLTHAITAALAGPHVYRTTMPPQGGPELTALNQLNQATQGRRSTLPDHTIVALHRCWCRRTSTRAAAAECGVSQATAGRYYRRFRSAAQ
ncbi:hypothetical protein ACFWOG_04435 [Kitasatospora sp. NPDC058406]|uniref:hypothetical protein n=1 Tax=Kitasatospora sp. NPDC058406 TaxID=3346483 RepID=UPI00364D7EFD